MRALLHSFLVLLVLALPSASAQEKAAKIKFKPKEVVKLQVLPGRPPQGIWQFGGGQYLVTQDIDGRGGKEWVRFTLFEEDGSIVKKWEMNYGTHGQSLFVNKTKNGYIIYTETANRRGLAIFEMNADKSELKFLNKVIPKDESGEGIEFSAFGVDENEDRVIVGNNGGNKWVRYYKFSDMTAGKLTPLSKRIHITRPDNFKQFGWLQGVGTDNGVGYVLTGDAELDSKKYISRVSEDGKVVRVEIEPDRDKAHFLYEPEGLYVRKGRILFSMYDHFWTRIYEVRAK